MKILVFILAFLDRSTNCRLRNDCFFWKIEFIKGIRFSNHVSGDLHTSYFHQCRCKLQRNNWNYRPILIKLRKISKYIEMLKNAPRNMKTCQKGKSGEKSPNLHPNRITSRCTGNIIGFIISYNPRILFDIPSYKIIKILWYMTKKCIIFSCVWFHKFQ